MKIKSQNYPGCFLTVIKCGHRHYILSSKTCFATHILPVLLPLFCLFSCPYFACLAAPILPVLPPIFCLFSCPYFACFSANILLVFTSVSHGLAVVN